MSRLPIGWGRALAMAVLAALVLGAAGPAPFAAERAWKTYESEKYGFSIKIPEEFELQTEENGASWVYQPGSTPGEATAKKKGFSVGAKIKGLAAGITEPRVASTGGGLESALSIHVNWVAMEDVAPETLYNANLDSVKKDMGSPDPDYADPIVFSKKQGYAHEGNAFWYKEVDKKNPDEIHRWHIGAYGNQSNYGVILGGVYGQFEEWGPVFEEVVKSFKLIPIKQ